VPYDLFISYSRRDNAQSRISELVECIKQDFASFEGMQGRELRVFFDRDEGLGNARASRAVFRALAENIRDTFNAGHMRIHAERMDARRAQPHPRAGVLPEFVFRADLLR
jgi:hypothetical protein